jgi:hypothetical protein
MCKARDIVGKGRGGKGMEIVCERGRSLGRMISEVNLTAIL